MKKIFVFLFLFSILLSGICLNAGKTNAVSVSSEIISKKEIVQQDIPENVPEFRLVPNIILF